MLAGTESSRELKFHLVFVRQRKPKDRKTNIYSVYKEEDGGREHLGIIKWYGAFRQYIHYPDAGTGWSKTCNVLINNFLDKVNKRHRNKLRKRKK